jgi:hypothetical protein
MTMELLRKHLKQYGPEHYAKVVPAHDQFQTLKTVTHYEDHEERSESAEFRAVKKKLHAEGVGCWIGNGRCEGDLEVHHNVVEYSAMTEVDWDKVKADHPNITTPEDIDGMMVLCAKHHRGIGTGIHATDYPTWELQKYLTPAALDKFEAAVSKLKEEK